MARSEEIEDFICLPEIDLKTGKSNKKISLDLSCLALLEVTS
jgi:hypothetical protein